MSEKDPTAALRVKRDQARKLEQGYRRISNLWINPKAARALRVLEKSGKSATSVINRLLLEQGKKL